MQQPYCLQLMSEPRLAAAHGTGVRLKLLRNTQHLCLGGCKLCPHAFSPFRRFFLLLCFLCQQSLGPVVSDQLHPCLRNGLDLACHAVHGPCEGMVPPSTDSKKRRSLSRRLLHTESNDLHFGLGKQMHFTMHSTLPFTWRTERRIISEW